MREDENNKHDKYGDDDDNFRMRRVLSLSDLILLCYCII